MADVKITEERILFDEHSTLKQLHFDRKKKNGEWESQVREVFDHGNAVTVMLYNREKKTVLFTKQFRIATFVNGNKDGILVETCAGLLEGNENPDDAVVREVEEETGFAITEVKRIFSAYSSPGAYSELVHYYLAPYTPQQKKTEGGGLAEEGEEVKVIEITFEEALQMADRGEIKDAKTILLLYYLQAKQLM